VEGGTDVDVSIDDFVGVCFGDSDAVYGCGCVGHGEGLRRVRTDWEKAKVTDLTLVR
jgi:hypothetical protein